MRIDAPGRPQTPAASAGARRADGAARAFSLDLGAGAAPKAGAPAAPTATTSLAALGAMLSLQEFEDPRERRKRGLKQGHELLDRLERLKIALLSGDLPDGEMDALVSTLSARLPTGDPKLESLLDDIDLRARVELAKAGRFPA